MMDKIDMDDYIVDVGNGIKQKTVMISNEKGDQQILTSSPEGKKIISLVDSVLKTGKGLEKELKAGIDKLTKTYDFNIINRKAELGVKIFPREHHNFMYYLRISKKTKKVMEFDQLQSSCE